ncbi:SWR1-complex protein 4 [Candida viswanathii]|uniref:SWR1-complex protein 4 n=1 Tax=Candida viswanathii TaxID=5486 RepID=A0A367YAJ7_9ASCO|nr:SWR1-complex protein 4 [Candida viswanathii]
MSANDILDVLNIQRDESNQQPAKKKQKTSSSTPTLPDGKQLTGMARELYNLVGPNTPPININSNSYNSNKEKFKKFKPSPWTNMPFKPKEGITLNHWVKGSKELLEEEQNDGEVKPYFFEKFNVNLEIPEFVDEETFDRYMKEIREYEKKLKEEKEARDKERKERESKEAEEKKRKQLLIQSKQEEKNNKKGNKSQKKEEVKKGDNKTEDPKVTKDQENPTEDKTGEDKKGDESLEKKEEKVDGTENTDRKTEEDKDKASERESEDQEEDDDQQWTYKETKHLFELCQAFELKWPIIHDRFPNPNRSAEDLKEQFYRMCIKILENQDSNNQSLIDSLRAYSKPRELERKVYLENLLKRTPAEIAEEESLVIEARRFELAAKKMLMERSNLLSLLDSPQSTQNVSQYQSSQGITNLYNNLLVYDNRQKKKLANKHPQQQPQDPVPPPIPLAASSSIKRDRGFQTHLQQYLSSLLKQNHHTNPAIKQEANSIQQLLMKRLTQKEEEAYGLYYHGTEKLTPGVSLRSQQKLPGLNQRQSILKSVNLILEEMDIPTAGGNNWKPVMPTRKTMNKYDELIRSVVTLLDVKKAKDKLESEIKLIKSQRGI